MTEINCKEILEKYFPLVIADEDEWGIQCVKAMQEACEQTKQACIKEAKVRVEFTDDTYKDMPLNNDSIKENVIIK